MIEKIWCLKICFGKFGVGKFISEKSPDTFAVLTTVMMFCIILGGGGTRTPTLSSVSDDGLHQSTESELLKKLKSYGVMMVYLVKVFWKFLVRE